MTKREAYVQKMKRQLDALNATADEIEARAKDARQEARAKYRYLLTRDWGPGAGSGADDGQAARRVRPFIPLLQVAGLRK